MGMKAYAVAGAALLIGMTTCTRASAEEADAGPYTGTIITETNTFPGGLRGYRNEAAAKGITLDGHVTQITQSVVGGGKDSSWEYGGRGDLTGKLDTQKLGLWPGGFLQAELEGNWGQSVNGNTGALSAADANALFPVAGASDVALPELSFTQFLSHYVGLTVGKLETTSGDANEFAHGKGASQFFNLAFNFNLCALTGTPYSTLGAGILVLPTGDPNAAVLSFVLISSNGSATTAGFDTLSGDALTFSPAGRVRTNFFDLTGHQSLGVQYSNKTFTSLDQRLGFVIENRALVPKSDTWNLYYNFDQYLYETDKEKGYGVGMFGRFGASDGNPNPVHYLASFGFGGKGMFDRPLDQFGIGYYYSWLTNPTLQRPFTTTSFLRDEWGIEAYYNVAILPWLLFTPDIQIVGPAQKRQIKSLTQRTSIGTDTIIGFRLQVII